MSVATKFHKLASPLLYKGGFYARHWLSRAAQRPFTVVLVYHRVLENDEIKEGMFDIERGVPASVFEEQMRFMLKHFAPVKASEALEASSCPLRFAVTLDDGYEDNLRVAAPILHRLGIPATFYVVSDHAGTDRRFWWERFAEIVRSTKAPHIELGGVVPEIMGNGLASRFTLQTYAQREVFFESVSAAMRAGRHEDITRHLAALADALDTPVPREEGRDYAMLDWDQLKALVQQGFEIGGHTANHRSLDYVDEAVLQNEIIDSNRVIENVLGVPVLSFAYPYGHYEDLGPSVGEALSATNCRVAYTGIQGVVEAGDKVFELKRTRLNRHYDFACAFNVQDSLR